MWEGDDDSVVKVKTGTDCEEGYLNLGRTLLKGQSPRRQYNSSNSRFWEAPLEMKEKTELEMFVINWPIDILHIATRVGCAGADTTRSNALMLQIGVTKALHIRCVILSGFYKRTRHLP